MAVKDRKGSRWSYRIEITPDCYISYPHVMELLDSSIYGKNKIMLQLLENILSRYVPVTEMTRSDLQHIVMAEAKKRGDSA